MNGQHIRISVGDVVIKNLSRTDCGNLEDLESSIRKLGVLFPIVVDKHNVLISGERRLKASKLAGLAEIPAFRLDAEYTSMTALDIRADENLCRLPLSGTELDQLIRMKKDAISTGRVEKGRSLLARIKKWFRPGARKDLKDYEYGF